MKKVICECGSSKWVLKNSLVYNCIPPIHADIYACAKCGKTYEKTTQLTMEEYYPEVEIFDNEQIEEIDISTIDLSYHVEKTTTQSDDLTGIDGLEDMSSIATDVSTLAEPSKVRYE